MNEIPDTRIRDLNSQLLGSFLFWNFVEFKSWADHKHLMGFLICKCQSYRRIFSHEFWNVLFHYLKLFFCQPAEAYIAGVDYTGSAWFPVGQCQLWGVSQRWAMLFFSVRFVMIPGWVEEWGIGGVTIMTSIWETQIDFHSYITYLEKCANE